MFRFFNKKAKNNDQFSLFVEQINGYISENENCWVGSFRINGKGFESFFPAIITYYDNLGIVIVEDKEDLIIDITLLLEEKEIDEEIKVSAVQKIYPIIFVVMFITLIAFILYHFNLILMI